MRWLIDNDVLLDVALVREPFLDEASAVLGLADQWGGAAVAWHSVANIAYIARSGSREFLAELLQIVEVVPTDTSDARAALALPMNDLEDAFQAVAAARWRSEVIVTRNVRDYRRSPIRAVSPATFLKDFPE